MANTILPKRHYFLALYADRNTSTFYIFDRLNQVVVAKGILTLEAGKEELRRVKHLPEYKQVAAHFSPPVPWVGATSETRGLVK